jgi:hypothetical protein
MYLVTTNLVHAKCISERALPCVLCSHFIMTVCKTVLRIRIRLGHLYFWSFCTISSKNRGSRYLLKLLKYKSIQNSFLRTPSIHGDEAIQMIGFFLTWHFFTIFTFGVLGSAFCTFTRIFEYQASRILYINYTSNIFFF